MRVLIVPLIGISNLAGDSDYLFYADIVKGAQDRGWYFYMVLPKHNEGEVPELPNCTYIWLPMGTDFFQESMSWPHELTEMFSRRDGKYLFDLLLTTRTGGSVVGQSVLSDFRRRDHVVPTVLMEAMVRSWKQPNDVDAALRAMSYAMAHTWLLSDEERLRALEMVRRVCSPYLAEKFVKRAKVIETGVRVQELDKVIAETPKQSKFTVFFGARFSVEKRPDIMQEFVEKFFSFGRDVNIVVTTQHVGSRYLLKYGKSSAYTELTPGCPRDEFLSKAASSQVFICTSEDESWPSGFWEQLYLIGIGIFPDKPWVRANLPKDYPYIYKDMMEGHAMLRYIYDNYEKALENVSWLREWIRVHANWRLQLDKALDWMETIPRPYYQPSLNPEGRKGKGLGLIMLEAAETFEGEFSWSEYLNKLGTMSETYKPNIIARTLYPSRYEVYRLLLDNGYRDLYNGQEARLVKEVK